MRDFVKRNKKLPKPFKYIDKKEDKERLVKWLDGNC